MGKKGKFGQSRGPLYANRAQTIYAHAALCIQRLPTLRTMRMQTKLIQRIMPRTAPASLDSFYTIQRPSTGRTGSSEEA